MSCGHVLWSSWMVVKVPNIQLSPRGARKHTDAQLLLLCSLQPARLFVSFSNVSLCYIYLPGVHVRCGSQGSNSGHQAWQQAALLSEPSNQPQLAFLLTLLARHKLMSFSFGSAPIWSPVCLKCCPVASHTANALLPFSGMTLLLCSLLASIFSFLPISHTPWPELLARLEINSE